MNKIQKWILVFAITFLLNFIGFFFYLYDVLGSRFENVNQLAYTYGGYTGPLFLLMLALLFILFYNEQKGGRNNYILRNLLFFIIPLIAFIGHILIFNNVLAVYHFLN